MKLKYVENDNGKLFSFHRHDFKEDTDSSGTYISIDGGFDYTRWSGPTLKEDNLEDVFPDVRQQFIWGQRYDKDNNLLPETIFRKLEDLDSDHVLGIIKYWLTKVPPERVNYKYLAIFAYEVIFRINNNDPVYKEMNLEKEDFETLYLAIEKIIEENEDKSI